MARCAAFKSSGEPCQRIVGASQTYCFAHDPNRAAERARNASTAARSPAKGRSTSEIRQIKGRLEDLYTAVLEGRAERAAAAVANQIANTRLRAIEVERKIKQTDELEGQLDEVKGLLENAERRTHVSRR